MAFAVAEIPGYVAGTWRIDTTHSEVAFVVRHLMISKVRGRFSEFEGEIVTASDPLKSSVSVTIDLASVDTGNAQRDEHLRSIDFFDVKEKSQMTYRSTGLRPDGERFVLDGELTLRGVTRTVPLTVEVGGFGPDPFIPDPFSGGRVGFSAVGEIDRTDFGVSYNGPIPGGGLGIGEKVRIEIEIEAALSRPGE